MSFMICSQAPTDPLLEHPKQQMTTEILYPAAYADDGQFVHISTASKAAAAYCFGCDARMDPHQGPQRQWHFHHRAQNRCDPDRALHMAAVAAIRAGIDSAIRAKLPYLLKRGCLRCGQLIEQDIATPGATVKAEKGLLQRNGTEVQRRTLPDIAIYAADGATTLVEVVVSHDIEDKTREVYKQAAIPVYRVYPDWQNLLALQQAATARDALNMPCSWCTDCQQWAEQVAKREAEQAREQRAKLAESDLMARFAPKLYIPELPRAAQTRGSLIDIEPGDCVIGIFTGVDAPGSRNVPHRAAPRWNFEDPATGVGVCVSIWPNKLRAEAHSHLIGRMCILTCWQEGISTTGNRNFRFKLNAMPQATR